MARINYSWARESSHGPNKQKLRSKFLYADRRDIFLYVFFRCSSLACIHHLAGLPHWHCTRRGKYVGNSLHPTLLCVHQGSATFTRCHRVKLEFVQGCCRHHCVHSLAGCSDWRSLTSYRIHHPGRSNVANLGWNGWNPRTRISWRINREGNGAWWSLMSRAAAFPWNRARAGSLE
jgi:hypothetical protein